MSDWNDWQTPQATAALIASGTTAGTPGGAGIVHNQSALALQATGPLAPGGIASTMTLQHLAASWELYCSFQGLSINPNAQGTIELLFQDQASGLTVDRLAFVYWAADQAASNGQQIFARGPTRGNQVTVKVQNPASAGVLNMGYLLTQSGRPYAYDTMRPINAPNSASGRNVPSQDVETGILAAHLMSAIGAGVTVTDQLPPFMGRAHIHWDSGSAAADCEAAIIAGDDSLHPLTTGLIFDKFTDSTGNGDADIVLPGTQCFIQVTNHNAAAKTMHYTITSAEY